MRRRGEKEWEMIGKRVEDGGGDGEGGRGVSNVSGRLN